MNKRNLLLLTSTFLFSLFTLFLFHSSPAFAAIAKSTSKSIQTSLPVKKKKSFITLFKRIIDGANSKKSLKNMKIGDSKSEFATLVNSFSAILFLGFLSIISSIYTTMRDVKASARAKKEVQRINEYKENMYFDAVADVIQKLADPSLKGSTKASLQKQLKLLDPDGKIAKFVTEGGSRPDMSDVINNQTKKKVKKNKSPSPSTSSSSSSAEKEVEVPKNKDPVMKRRDFQEKKEEEKEEEDLDEGGSEDEAFKGLMATLFDSLAGSSLSVAKRRQLIGSLEDRVSRIVDEEKKKTVIAKIGEKLGDTDYWINYASKL